MGSTRGPLARTYVEQAVWAARCGIFALKADQEEREGEARLFRAMARAAEVHARKALLLLRGGVGRTAENLAECIGNRRALVRALPDAVEAAGREADKAGVALLCQMLDAARSHCDCLRGLDTGLVAAYHVCAVCGYVAVDARPEGCPVCGAPAGKFEATP